MVIVHIGSGLGNQMFQYALYKKIKSINEFTYADCSTLSDDFCDEMMTPRISDVFNVEIDYASNAVSTRWRDYSDDYISKIRRKLFGYKKHYYVEETPSSYSSDIFYKDNVYLHGGWQNYKYFEDIELELRDDFTFQFAIEKNDRILEKIKQSKLAIAVQYRAYEDYTVPKLGKPCTHMYYEGAIDYFERKYPGASFFLFSMDRDMEEAIERTKGHNVIPVFGNEGRDSWQDMYLMTQCDHYIIANSTFAWWGAWINPNKNKEVITPDQWFTFTDAEGLYIPGWIRVDSEGNFK